MKIGSREHVDMLISYAFAYVQTGVSDTVRGVKNLRAGLKWIPL